MMAATKKTAKKTTKKTKKTTKKKVTSSAKKKVTKKTSSAAKKTTRKTSAAKKKTAAKKEAAPKKAATKALPELENLDRKGLAARARQLKTELLAIRFNLEAPSLSEYKKKRSELARILGRLS